MYLLRYITQHVDAPTMDGTMADETEMGRPPKYDKEICKKVISLGKQGYSLTQIALELDIARSTLYEWRDKYPDFSDAIKKGREFAQGFWENALRSAALGLNPDNTTPNPTLMIFQMKNRFADEWREKQTTEHEVNGAKKVVVEWGE